jgi:type II secretory pathway component PulC
LLENPFDELKNIRLRPADEGLGLKVEWINSDSVFAQLGVQEDDVFQGVNGIAFRNAMDLNNAMSSLIASDQFVVDVVRDGVPTLLHYEVR